jgi:hypothetical protein
MSNDEKPKSLARQKADEAFAKSAAEALENSKLNDGPIKDALGKVAEKIDKNAEEHAIAIHLAKATLTGDIRDFLLDRVKALGKPWAAMTEDEQADQIHSAKEAAERLVTVACEIIAADGKKAMKGKLKTLAIDKDVIKATVLLSKEDEQRHQLLDAAGLAVMVVVADAEYYRGEQAPAEPTPSQSDLIDKAEKLKKGKDKVSPLFKRKDTDGDE